MSAEYEPSEELKELVIEKCPAWDDYVALAETDESLKDSQNMDYFKSILPTRTIDKYGVTNYKLNGEYHRLNGPAIIHKNGDCYWYEYGKYIRRYRSNHSFNEKYFINDSLRLTPSSKLRPL